MTVTDAPVDNGVKVEALLGARGVLAGAPEASQFKWRAACTWVHGTHSQTAVQSNFDFGEEQSHKTEFTFDADASPEDLKALIAQSQKRSAVYDIVSNPTDVTVEVN